MQIEVKFKHFIEFQKKYVNSFEKRNTKEYELGWALYFTI